MSKFIFVISLIKKDYIRFLVSFGIFGIGFAYLGKHFGGESGLLNMVQMLLGYNTFYMWAVTVVFAILGLLEAGLKHSSLGKTTQFVSRLSEEFSSSLICVVLISSGTCFYLGLLYNEENQTRKAIEQYETVVMGLFVYALILSAPTVFFKLISQLKEWRHKRS